MSKDWKKIELSTQKILFNHLNSYICVHKYRENAKDLIADSHNSCYLPFANERKGDLFEEWKVPQHPYWGESGTRKEGDLLCQNNG